MSENTDI